MLAFNHAKRRSV